MWRSFNNVKPKFYNFFMKLHKNIARYRFTFAVNMKRSFVIFLSLMYLVVSTGFITSDHFCKGVKQETSFFSTPSKDKVCPICATKRQLQNKNENCCKHQTQLNKFDDSFSNKLQKQNVFKLLEHIPFICIENIPVLDFAIVELKSGNFSNPNFLLKKNPLYIYHCVYRI